MNKRASMTIKELITFMFAGESYFTLENTKTGNFEQYRVKRFKRGFFVSTKKHKWEEEEYMWSYIGCLWSTNPLLTISYGVGLNLHRTRGVVVLETDPSILGFKWLLRQIEKKKEFEDHIRVVHHGLCGRCGRRLTDDVSVALGYGPTCYKKINEEITTN
jgi:hypothetical protein